MPLKVLTNTEGSAETLNIQREREIGEKRERETGSAETQLSNDL